MQNRRAHPRFDTSLSLEIFTGRELVTALAMNLSSGGVGISSPSPLQAEASVGLSLFLVEEGIEDERTPPLNVQGKVVWCKQQPDGQYQAGVRFLTMSPEHLQRIRHFLDRLSG